jgi:acid phosphatase
VSSIARIVLGAAVLFPLSCGSSAAARPPIAPEELAPTLVTKVLVVVEENHSLGQMREGMPATFELAQTYGYATRYRAITHPSLPNYLAIVSGRTFGVRDDGDPADHRLRGSTVFGQALDAGLSARLYAQGMPVPCGRRDSGRYVVRHNPWAYFTDERTQCRVDDVSFHSFKRDALAGTLPDVGMVIPDLDHDAHDGSLAQADVWFSTLMDRVFAGPDWQAGRLVVILTADEDDRAHGNRVLTVVLHPSQQHHVVDESLTHYSLTRLFADVTGLPYLGRASEAPSMTEAFGLPVPPARRGQTADGENRSHPRSE